VGVPNCLEMGDLPRMKNAPLIDHIVVAITTTTLFLFQIAMLMGSISSYLGERILLLEHRRHTHGSQARVRRPQGPGMPRPRRVNQNVESSLIEA
jgi:hypothetical protein